MPVNGLIKALDVLEIGVDVSASVSGNQTYTATTDSLYTPNDLTLVSGISLTVASSNAGAGTYTGTYRGPNEPFGGYVVSGAGFASSQSMSARLIDYRLYATFDSGSGDCYFRATCSSIEIWYGGALSTTLAGFDTGKTLFLAPSYVYPYSGMVYVSGNPSVVNPGAGGHTISTFTISGGVRWQEVGSGVWSSSVVTVPPVSVEASTTLTNIPPIPGTHPAPFGLHLADSVLSTSTWGSQLYLTDDWQRDTGTGTDRTTYGGSVWIFANNARSFKRMATGSRFTISRSALPSVTATSARQGVKNSGPLGTSAATTTLAVAYAAAGPTEVTDSAGSIEAPLADNAYAFCIVSAHKETSIGTGGIVNEEDLTFQYPSVLNSTGVPSDLLHFYDEATYFNTVVNPHWSFWRDNTTRNVDGSPETVDAYWWQVRQQHNPTSGSRNHIVADPLGYSGLSTFEDSLFGAGGRFVGISRWQTKSVTPLTDYTYDAGSEPLWSCAEGELAFVAEGVIVTPV